MKKLLISWLAFHDDFLRNTDNILLEVKPDGPNAAMHAHYFEGYDEHLILHIHRDESEFKAELLRTFIHENFPDHQCRLQRVVLMEKDLINLPVIQAKVQTILLGHRDAQLDLFATPGTPAMHTVWHLAHLDPDLNTRLFQIRPARFSETGIPELIEIEFDHSEIPGAAIIQEKNLLEVAEPDTICRPKALERPFYLGTQIARTDNVSCLILGESGTGKEVMARHILNNSPRKSGPYHAINCSSLPDSLLGSLLFGHKKGAFTGADKDFDGYFKKANGGTIFLDEIGDISPFMQQSLLRVLQEKEVLPVGAEKAEPVDVRVIAATNRDLASMCKEGRFRWDLYYRLSVIEIQLPCLIEWGTTAIRDLFNHFLDLKKKELRKPTRLRMSRKVKKALLGYHYPGNIREMENLVARLYVISNGEEVRWSDLPKRVRELFQQSPLRLEAVEESHIRKVLRLNDYKLAKTAEALGIAFNTLKSKIAKYGIKS